MQKLRSMGIFIFVCALFCLVVAVDKYYSAVKTAEALTERMPGFVLEQVSIPTVSLVTGFIGVMLLVAGVICVVQSFQSPANEI
jgi:uncharacterized membrane protein SpoIIM required for sporulation